MMLTSVNSTSAVIASSSGRFSLDELTVRLVAVPGVGCQDLPETRQVLPRLTCNCVSPSSRHDLKVCQIFQGKGENFDVAGCKHLLCCGLQRAALRSPFG